MLMFKKKFLEDIRSGRKTQTLRCWKWSRFRTGQRSFIPGAGHIRITLVEEVRLEDLTDEDAIPDGFPTIEALRRELATIYGDPLPGRLFRIRFRLEPKEEEPTEKGDAAVEKAPVEAGDSVGGNASAKEKKAASRNRKGTAKKPSKVKKTGNAKEPKPVSSETETAQANLKTATAHGGLQGLTLHSVQRESVRSETETTATETVPTETAPKGENVEEGSVENVNAKPVYLTEEEVADKLMVRCRIHRNSCDWNHEPGKALDFFALFLKSPRNDAGVPTLDGYRLQSLMRQRCSAEEWEAIGWLASDVCRSWTEWQYAIEKWCGASSAHGGDSESIG